MSKHVFTLEVSFSVDTHFLSRRSIRGLRTDSASMAALLPLAEPFICTSSWFICFTQSSITGLKLGNGKQRNLLLWNAIMHFRWGKTRRLEEALAHRCQSYWITIKVSRARWSFIQAEMFSTSISSLSASAQRRLNCTLRTCLAVSNRSRCTVPCIRALTVTLKHLNAHRRVLTNAHLEPKTPLSSSSTVLSLFCSSFSRSLASASSCHRKKDLLQHHYTPRRRLTHRLDRRMPASLQ